MSDGFVIALIGIIAMTTIICLPIILVFWLVARKRSDRQMSTNEEERLRRIWAGLQKMEERIDNLETILSARPRKDELERAARGADVRSGRVEPDTGENPR
ncbi:MAG: hypothetical protein JSW67_13415 [Candidatus Latescibacterota bacterium]|nr:MAG: hypothetical protein JSW67_13415 [Candidatus Latescibacterota bacterium]